MIPVEPIAVVRSPRTTLEDDHWGDVESAIVLAEHLPAEALDGIEEFSHVEVLFQFHRLDPATVVTGARHPRDDPAWPRVGILAQRGAVRPNRLGATIAEVRGRSADGRELRVRGLDAVDGTPVLDVKPVMREFLPRGEVRQPAWSREVMRDYWRGEGG